MEERRRKEEKGMGLLLASFFVLLFSFFALQALDAQAQSSGGATLYVGPGTGTFTVGSTFTISFYVDTSDEFINAVETKILFPPDKLQVVSPSTGSSFINVWAIAPSYSNTEGTISFRGAVPSPGVNTDNGLISTVTFRVKSVGDAIIRFSDDSRVLRNDGLGTDILQQKQSGVYRLVLPPPAGPIVASDTHPDQGSWSQAPTAVLNWASDAPAAGYSYVLNELPVDAPDDISEGTATSAIYRNLPSGRHYFHIKALRGGVWGGTTHYAVNVDAEPPAEFNIEIIPSKRTSRQEPVIRWLTTDSHSGINFYEIKIVGLNVHTAFTDENQNFFVEANSPYLPSSLPFGSYDVIVRAHDRAGNVQEIVSRLDIVKPLFKVIEDRGISFRDVVLIPWWLVWTLAAILLMFLGVIAYRFEEWHREVHHARENKKLPSDVSSKLEELKEYQRKYGKAAVILLILVSSFSILVSAPIARAQTGEIAPPVITEVSKNIFNDEIFYVGGRTAEPESEVIIFLQNLDGGATVSQRLASDEEGRWFYRHPAFLPSGTYLIWAQSKKDSALSPPSPQATMTVVSHAIQLGATRISYTAIYLVSIIFLLGVLIVLAILLLHHYRHAKRKHRLFSEEVRRAEESIRRGFALLRRDLESEFALLANAKMSRVLSREEQAKEEQIMRDLELVKRQIGEEIWELEKKEA